MSDIESLVNSLRGMELPKGAESLLSTILSKSNDLEGERDKLKKSLDSREEDNKKARDEIKELKTQIVPEGSSVVPNADKVRLDEYKALGPINDLKAMSERVGTLEADKAKSEREATIRAAGFEPKKLERILGSNGLKVTGEGDEMKVLVTKDDTETPLDEWAEAEEVTDLLNVARLEQDRRPVGMPQAGADRGRQQSTWGQAANDRFGSNKKE